MKIVMKLLVSSLAVFIAGSILPGVSVDSFVTAVLVAIVLGAVNMILRPILVILTLPITIITLGLFAFVINALLVLLVDYLVPGFRVDGFLTALLFSFVLSIISWFLNSLVK